jgi:hypothetical protein
LAFAHPGFGALASAESAKLGAHESALFLGYGWHSDYLISRSIIGI